MFALKDRVINVPLTDDDIEATTNILPRVNSNNFLVNVKLKRTMHLKNVHSESLVRPNALICALEKFKALGNSHYEVVVIDRISPFTLESNKDSEDCVLPADSLHEKKSS